jgi:hypothetical protein
MSIKTFPKQIRPLLQGLSTPHKDNSLVRNRLLDIRIDCLAIKLGFHPSEELPFVLRNTQALECLFNLVRNLIPRPLGGIARSEVITDQVEVYFLELVARPMRRQRLTLKDIESIFAKLPQPFGLPFHIDDVVDRLLRKANTRIPSWLEIVEKITDAGLIVFPTGAA